MHIFQIVTNINCIALFTKIAMQLFINLLTTFLLFHFVSLQFVRCKIRVQSRDISVEFDVFISTFTCFCLVITNVHREIVFEIFKSIVT